MATALRVNKLLNVEVEKYVHASEQLEAERDAWQRHAKRLAGMHTALQRKAAGLPPDDGGEELAALMQLQQQQAERDGAQDGPSTTGMAVQPTPAQQQVMQALVARGKAAGWLIKPDEVRHRRAGPLLG